MHLALLEWRECPITCANLSRSHDGPPHTVHGAGWSDGIGRTAVVLLLGAAASWPLISTAALVPLRAALAGWSLHVTAALVLWLVAESVAPTCLPTACQLTRVCLWCCGRAPSSEQTRAELRSGVPLIVACNADLI